MFEIGQQVQSLHVERHCGTDSQWFWFDGWTVTDILCDGLYAIEHPGNGLSGPHQKLAFVSELRACT